MKKRFIVIGLISTFVVAILIGGFFVYQNHQKKLYEETVTTVQNYFSKYRYVYQDLDFDPEINGIDISYQSSDLETINAEGKIKRPYVGNVDVEIIVTIGKSDVHTYTVTVISQKYLNLEKQLLKLMPSDQEMIFRDLNFNRLLDNYQLEYQFSSSFDNGGAIAAQNDRLQNEQVKITIVENDENNIYYQFDFAILPVSVRTLCEQIREVVPELTATDVNLPSNIDRAMISWKSLTPDIITDDGSLKEVKNRKFEGLLEASIKYHKNNYKVNFNIVNTNTVEDVFAFIEEQMKRNLNTYVYSTLKTNVDSYYKGMFGASFSYRSLNPEYLTDEGGYIPHEYDETVGLEITVNINGVQHVFVHNLISRGVDDETKVERISDWLENYFKTTELTHEMRLPRTHERYAGKISWISFNNNLVDNQYLLLPEQAGVYEIGAEIIFNKVERRFIYEVNLNRKENLSIDQEVIDFIKRSMPDEINKTTTLYDGVLPVITNEIIPETAPYFNRMTSGKMKTPSQALLDQVYPGYQLPNEQNILWIVVHETGMSTVGLYANVFSNLQQNRSQNGFGSDATASWHYTVDDHQIIQNFEDNQAVYHAGDGAGSYYRGGNSNGIGIEMCINAGSNFEAAMRNNAKLIASLLHKYNLTLENVKQHYDFSSYQKPCPQTIRAEYRWFEFLSYVANEYKAQSLLKDKEITYAIQENPYVDLWQHITDEKTYTLKMLNVYALPSVEVEIIITVHYKDEEYQIITKVKP